MKELIKEFVSDIKKVLNKAPFSVNEQDELSEIESEFWQNYNLEERRLFDIKIEEDEHKMKMVDNLALQAWTQGMKVEFDKKSFNEWWAENKGKYCELFGIKYEKDGVAE